jgi:hypothetical protein
MSKDPKRGAKALAGAGIIAAIFGGGGADKARDNFAKGQHRENQARVQRETGRRKEYSSGNHGKK